MSDEGISEGGASGKTSTRSEVVGLQGTRFVEDKDRAFGNKVFIVRSDRPAGAGEKTFFVQK